MMTKILIPERPTTNKVSEEVVKNDERKRKPASKRSSTSDTKLARSKNVKNTSKSRTKKTSKVLDKKKEEKTERTPNELESTFDVRSVLGERYVPEIEKFGKNEGYVFLPRSIFDWICMYKYDWYKKLNEFPFYRDIDIIRSLLYYIIEDGYVYIQENRYYKFYKIKISEE